MKRTNNKLFSKAPKVLKATDMHWSKPFLTRGWVVLAISIIAATIDGFSIHFTLSPILKGLAAMCLLVTFVFSCVLDLLPNYFTLGFARIQELKKQNENEHATFVKVSIIAAAIVWLIAFGILCAVRSATAPIVLNDLIRQYAADKKSTFQVTPQLQQFLMWFLNICNLGTSAWVLIANIVSFRSLKEALIAKKMTTNLVFQESEAEADRELEELEGVATISDDDIEAYVSTRVNNETESARAQAVSEKVFSREVLESTQSDSDVTIQVTADSKKVVQPSKAKSPVQPADSPAKIENIA